MKKHFKSIIAIISICVVFPFLLFRWLYKALKWFYRYLYTEWKRQEFNYFPSIFMGGGIIFPRIEIIGGKYITIGKNVLIYKGSIISAWSRYKKQCFNPSIKIGNNCGIGERAHITAINKIILGNGVLLGKHVTITDNSHGEATMELLNIRPGDRPLFSKGPIVIEDNVWIGDKATILPNVRIGKGAIIGANTVVSKDIPDYAIVVGNPMRIIKILK